MLDILLSWPVLFIILLVAIVSLPEGRRGE